MKAKLFITRFLSIALVTTLFASCKKENPYCNVKKPFKAHIDTWYRLSPADPIPVEVDGTTYIGFAYFPGGGTGNATHLGDCYFYFNQLAYSAADDALPAGSIGAPVVDVINYPVTGAPLPLMQAGDFTEFYNENNNLHIPTDVLGQIVNSVFYDGRGNAIFTSAIKGSGHTFPISKTFLGFDGKAIIVGGRGKFKHAKGEFDYEGYFNAENANDAEFNTDGWIAY